MNICDMYDACIVDVLTYKEVLLNHWFNEPFIFDTIKSLHP